MATLTQRPLIQDLVKAAMEDAVTRAKRASAEATRQSGVETPQIKEASAGSVPTELAMKLAAALDAATPIVSSILKKADVGEGPNALQVLEAPSGPPVAAPGQEGHGTQIQPMDPPMQKGKPQEQGTTQMQNTIDHAPGGSGTQQGDGAGFGGKTASLAEKNLARITKLAASAKTADTKCPKCGHEMKGCTCAAYKKEEKKEEKKEDKEEEKKSSANLSLADYFLKQTKTAEDALNPAQISGGSVAEHTGLESGESGGMASPPRADMVSSNEAAINLTKGQAKAHEKEVLKKYWDEPALSAAHDKTLEHAFTHTGDAGVKISSAQDSTRIAAARALLTKLSEEVSSS